MTLQEAMSAARSVTIFRRGWDGKVELLSVKRYCFSGNELSISVHINDNTVLLSAIDLDVDIDHDSIRQMYYDGTIHQMHLAQKRL